jgi:hypothetical protein
MSLPIVNHTPKILAPKLHATRSDSRTRRNLKIIETSILFKDMINKVEKNVAGPLYGLH